MCALLPRHDNQDCATDFRTSVRTRILRELAALEISASHCAHTKSPARQMEALKILLIGSTALSLAEAKLYFVATDAAAGRELHAYDAATGTQSLVSNILTTTAGTYSYDSGGSKEDGGAGFGGSGGSFSNLAAYDGKLYFTADDGTHGSELWVYDPATLMSFIVTDISAYSSPVRAAMPRPRTCHCACMRGCSAVYACACGPGCERVWRVASGLTRVDRIAVWLHRLRWQAVLPGGRRDPWQRALGVRLRHHHRLGGRRHQRRRDRLGSSASRDASTSHVSLRACGAAARCIRALAVQGVSACGAWPVG